MLRQLDGSEDHATFEEVKYYAELDIVDIHLDLTLKENNLKELRENSDYNFHIEK